MAPFLLHYTMYLQYRVIEYNGVRLATLDHRPTIGKHFVMSLNIQAFGILYNDDQANGAILFLINYAQSFDKRILSICQIV